MSSLETIFGASLVGIIIGSAVYGIYCCQAYTYFLRYPNDKLWTKALVASLWLILSLQFATQIHAIYVYLITDFGDLDKLQYTTWDWLLYILYTSVVATAVQLFFARRVFLLTQHWAPRWVLAAAIGILSLVELATGMWVLAECYKLKIFLDFTKTSWGASVWLGCGSACDILIAASMCYFLQINRTGLRKTDRLINVLMAYAIQTGAITSITEIICMATFTQAGYHFGHILLIYPLPGLYATSLLANLHSRQFLDRHGTMNIIELNAGGESMPDSGVRIERSIKFAPSTSNTAYIEQDPSTIKAFEPFDSGFTVSVDAQEHSINAPTEDSAV